MTFPFRLGSRLCESVLACDGGSRSPPTGERTSVHAARIPPSKSRRGSCVDSAKKCLTSLRAGFFCFRQARCDALAPRPPRLLHLHSSARKCRPKVPGVACAEQRTLMQCRMSGVCVVGVRGPLAGQKTAVSQRQTHTRRAKRAKVRRRSKDRRKTEAELPAELAAGA